MHSQRKVWKQFLARPYTLLRIVLTGDARQHIKFDTMLAELILMTFNSDEVDSAHLPPNKAN